MRDKAANRAELFGSHEANGAKGRKDFVDYVVRSISGTEPQLFSSRDGRTLDRRRAVSRLIISPERSGGLDLRAGQDRLRRSARLSATHDLLVFPNGRRLRRTDVLRKRLP